MLIKAGHVIKMPDLGEGIAEVEAKLAKANDAMTALEKEVTDLLKAHFGLRMQKGTQQLGNTALLGNTRRDIARAKTILAEKKRSAAK